MGAGPTGQHANSEARTPAGEGGVQTAAATEASEGAATSEAPESAQGADRDSQTTLQKVLAVVSSIGPPVTVATALIVYFGWARSNAQARAMGLDVSLFGYTPQDYGLRSIGSLFFPLVCILLLSLLWLAADTWLRVRLRPGQGHPRLARLAAAAVIGGAGLTLVSGAFAVVSPQGSFLLVPFLMAAGVLLAEWGVRLRRLTSPRGPVPEGKARVQKQALESTLVFTLVTVLLFWGVSDFAQVVGRGQAASIEAKLPGLPRADIYSHVDLSIGAPGVTQTLLGTESSPVYKYTGLRLLVLSGGRFFLLPDGWTLLHGTVVVLPDNDAVRLEFRNG